MKEFKTATDGTGTTPATEKTHFLCTILCREVLKEFDVFSGQVGSTTNINLKLVKEDLLR